MRVYVARGAGLDAGTLAGHVAGCRGPCARIAARHGRPSRTGRERQDSGRPRRSEWKRSTGRLRLASRTRAPWRPWLRFRCGWRGSIAAGGSLAVRQPWQRQKVVLARLLRMWRGSQPTTHRKMNMLPINHPKHLRRLVREINENRSGVYLAAEVAGTPYNPRLCGRARLERVVIGGAEVHRIAFPTSSSAEERPVTFRVNAAQVTEEIFIDGGTGRGICASRKP